MTTASRKVTQTELKTDDNYLVIRFSYSCALVMPHKDAMQCLASLQKAEFVNRDDYRNPSIEPLREDSVEIFPLSREKYVQWKTAHLLGIPSSELNQPKTQEAS